MTHTYISWEPCFKVYLIYSLIWVALRALGFYKVLKGTWIRAGEMAQWVSGACRQVWPLESDPRIHKVEGENQLLNVVLWCPHAFCATQMGGLTHTCAHMHTKLKINQIFKKEKKRMCQSIQVLLSEWLNDVLGNPPWWEYFILKCTWMHLCSVFTNPLLLLNRYVCLRQFLISLLLTLSSSLPWQGLV